LLQARVSQGNFTGKIINTHYNRSILQTAVAGKVRHTVAAVKLHYKYKISFYLFNPFGKFIICYIGFRKICLTIIRNNTFIWTSCFITVKIREIILSVTVVIDKKGVIFIHFSCQIFCNGFFYLIHSGFLIKQSYYVSFRYGPAFNEHLFYSFYICHSIGQRLKPCCFRVFPYTNNKSPSFRCILSFYSGKR